MLIGKCVHMVLYPLPSPLKALPCLHFTNVLGSHCPITRNLSLSQVLQGLSHPELCDLSLFMDNQLKIASGLLCIFQPIRLPNLNVDE